MSRTAIKHQAQDIIMQKLADALLTSEEAHEDSAIVDEMRVQAIRIGKVFGCTAWPGIGSW